MTMLDPEIQKMMYQQRMQNWIGGLAQGLMRMGDSNEGVVPGLLKAVAGANTGQQDPMSAINMQMRMEQLAGAKKDREREAAREMATKTLLSRHLGKTYEPESGMMWNQAERAIPGSAGTTDIADLGPQTAGIVPPMARRPVDTDVLMAQADPEGMLERLTATPKDPLIRDFKEGDEFVTKRFNRETREWEPTGSRAPRYKPAAADITVEAPDISGLSGLMTASQRGQEVADLKQQRGDAVAMVDMGYSLVDSLRESGNQAVSWAGTMARGVNTLASQGEAIAQNFGVRMADGTVKKALNADDWAWPEMAEASARNKSKILGLAVAITKADQGSRPSDFDVQTSINRIAGNSGDAEITASVIEDLLNEKMRGFSHRYNLAAPDYELAPFDWDETLSTLKIEKPKAPTADDPLGIR